MFQLSQDEFNDWRSQFVTSSEISLRSQSVTLENGRGKYRKSLPFVFTEQGVSMLSSVLRSETAIAISVKIIRAFIQMRKFIASNAGIFQRFDKVEQKQLITDTKILNAIELNEIKPKQGIFYNGQIFNAYKLLSDIVRTAQKSIIIIDNKTVYHFGTSLKDLGKKWFTFSKLEINAKDLIERLDNN